MDSQVKQKPKYVFTNIFGLWNSKPFNCFYALKPSRQNIFPLRITQLNYLAQVLQHTHRELYIDRYRSVCLKEQ